MAGVSLTWQLGEVGVGRRIYRQPRPWQQPLTYLTILLDIPIFKSNICHYGDVIMGAIASQITSLTIVYSTVYSDTGQRKHQSSASLAFERGFLLGPVNSPHKWPVTRKMSLCDDVIMIPHFWINTPLCYVHITWHFILHTLFMDCNADFLPFLCHWEYH